VYETLIKQHLNIETVLKSEVDFKSRLIEWGQKNKVDVFFEVTDASYDAQNNPVFSSCVKVGGVEIGSGKGYSKKESHQMAAKVAIRKLRESNELQEVIARTASTGISNPDNRMEKTSLPDFEEEQNTEEL
jgi:ribonuclease-3